MTRVANVVSKISGAAGIALAGYDTLQLTKAYTHRGGEHQQAHYLEKFYFKSRTIDNESVLDNGVRNKSFDVLQKNPLPSFWGQIKGGAKGFFTSIGNNFFLLLFSILACGTKGKLAKFSAAGIGLTFIAKILRHGLGLGKENPIE